MSNKTFNVLFLCTGNSVRSILAEAMMRKLGGDRFQVFSAGSHPVGRMNPYTMEALQTVGASIEGLRSKSWNEFAAPDAPALDFIFTLCDKVAGETCPVMPGRPATAHWGVEDPGHVEGEEAKKKAFLATVVTLSRRIELFRNLPFESLDRLSLQQRLAEIGRA